METSILIVEDEFIVADDLRLTLEEAGYEICGIAASVEEARDLIKRHCPSIVLLDIHLKGNLNGIVLARELKEQNIGFIYLSANSNRSILEAAKSTEPYGFLVKPWREKDLLVAIDIALYHHQHGMEARWKREMQLERSLAAIQRTEASWEQRIILMAKALQTVVPFDCLCGKTNAIAGSAATFFCLLRIGFDEYQYIGVKELAVIAKRPEQEMIAVMQATPAEVATAIYDQPALLQTWSKYPMKKCISGLFDMQSNIVQPLLTFDGQIRPLSFYSHKTAGFTAEHLAQLSRVQAALSSIVNPEPVLTQHIPLPASLPDKVVPQQGRILGKSPALLEALDLVTRVAPLDTAVLITGESGVGKERIVDYIHALSPRKKKIMVKINCAAFPSSLIESELFGHERGAFTGATEKRVGKFELADGGTIFLDEIGDMPLDLQVKLLRVLQEKEFERVGGSHPIKVNVRVIAATNKDLEQEMAEGRFRLDLYYRLNVFPIRVPSLRDRKDDIALLADAFARQMMETMGKSYQGISSQMLRELQDYDWPGNIRELENVVEQAVILTDGKSPLHLRQSLTVKTSNILSDAITTIDDMKRVQRRTEIAHLSSVLSKTKGRVRGKNGAAEILNEKPTTLESRLAKLGLRKEDFR
jgi:DNA-binding NtrC family response regulator